MNLDANIDFNKSVIKLLIEIHIQSSITNDLLEQVLANQTNVPLSEVQSASSDAFAVKRTALFQELAATYGDIDLSGFFAAK